MATLRTIDAHAAGAPLRLIVEGFPSPRGRTMAEKLGWARRHGEPVRRSLMLEPRGHRDMSGAVLTEPVAPGSHAGVLFMHGADFSSALDHGLIALTAIVLERGLIFPGGEGASLVFDTVAGTVRASAAPMAPAGDLARVRVTRVTCTLPPAFVISGGLSVRAAGRVIPADVVFGGACLAVVDAEAAGVGLTVRHLPEVRRAGVAILAALTDELRFVHPGNGDLGGIHGVVFTGPAVEPEADLRAVLLFGDGQIAASPAEAALGALVALLDVIGLLGETGGIAVDSLAGPTWTVRVAARTRVGDYEAVVPEVTGSAWLTGEHSFFKEAGDPLSAGFRL